MTVPRRLKLARRRMIENDVIDRPWIIDKLVPAITVGLILWVALLVGAR